MNDIQTHKVITILKENVIPYLDECVEAAIENCGMDDEIVTKPAMSANVAAKVALKMLEGAT